MLPYTREVAHARGDLQDLRRPVLYGWLGLLVVLNRR